MLSYTPTSRNTSKGTRVLPREKKELTKEELLKHFVQEGTMVLQNLDNLGNFLMGFGVLILGYLLNVDLKVHFQNLTEWLSWDYFSLSVLTLFAWSCSIILLLGFIYLFVFHLLAGRAIYAHDGKREIIGERIPIKRMSYSEFEEKAPDYDTFLHTHYLPEDQFSDTQLWYATFRYTRYMAYRKLMVMNRMRELLGLALLSGVIFKLLDILVQAL